MGDREYVITLDKEIWLPETDRWTGGGADVIYFGEYDMEHREVVLFNMNTGHNGVRINRENVYAIAPNPDDD